MIFSLLFSIIYYKSSDWLVFLTNWNIVIVLIYFIWVTTISSLYALKKIPLIQNSTIPETNPTFDIERHHQVTECLPLHLKLFWFWFNLTYLVSSLVFIMYWGFVTSAKDFSTSLLAFSTINDHGISFGLLIIDLTFHRIPLKFYHFLYTWVVAGFYITVTVIYNFVTNQPVYSVLNWKQNPVSAAITTIIALLLVVIVQILMLLIYFLKLRYKSGV